MTRNKLLTAFLTMLAAGALWAQDAATPSVVEDDTIPAALAVPVAASASKVKMGIWIEATSDTGFLTRDIATGEKKGYEVDNSLLYTKGNWWVWGELTPGFTLDAEIGVWETTKYLYKSNSYADNVADTTLTDGAQNVTSIFFGPVSALNDDGVGMNKLGVTLKTPLLDTKVGYGELKANGMAEYKGIFNILDRWDDVGDGFTEFSNGEKLQSFGDNAKLRVLAGLSKMRAANGIYTLSELSWADLTRLGLTWTSTTNASELFRYDEDNSNAASAFLSVKPLPNLELKAHGIAWYGTGTEASLDTMGGALEALLSLGPWSLDLTGKVGGPDVTTVWGDDTSLAVDAYYLEAEQWLSVGNALKLGLQEDFTMNDLSGVDTSLWSLDSEPMLDYAWERLLGVDLTSRLYGIITADRIAETTDASKPWTVYLSEAGVELEGNNVLPGVKHLVFDYAARLDYGDWQAADDAYDTSVVYNSVMLQSQLTDALGAGIAGLYRVDCDNTGSSFVPFGFACSANLQTPLKAIGSPKIWMNFTFGMDPFVGSDDDYNFYRHDDPDNDLGYRSYLLDDLYDVISESHIRFGLIWDL